VQVSYVAKVIDTGNIPIWSPRLLFYSLGGTSSEVMERSMFIVSYLDHKHGISYNISVPNHACLTTGKEHYDQSHLDNAALSAKDVWEAPVRAEYL
jgi:hypothetical protein